MTTSKQIQKARRYDRALARHGYLTDRASEVLLANALTDPKLIGGHARWCCREILDGEISTPFRTLRFLSFVEGVLFSLGIFTLEEMFGVSDE